MKFEQRTEMTNRGDEPSSIYGWPVHLVGCGIKVTVEIDPELKEIMPDALSRKLCHFLQDIMVWHYARREDMPGAYKSTSIDTRVDPWPLPTTVEEGTK
jgi:hypothetical protein